MFARIIPIAYLLIGLLVAAQHNYLADVHTGSRALSAALAVILWPMVLLGVQFSIK